MRKSSKNNVFTVQTIDHENMYDFPSEEYCKWSSDGEWVYLKRVFENGQILFSRFDINDPGQNEIPITRQAYTAVRCEQFQR